VTTISAEFSGKRETRDHLTEQRVCETGVRKMEKKKKLQNQSVDGPIVRKGKKGKGLKCSGSNVRKDDQKVR